MPNVRSLCMAGLAVGALAVPSTAAACPLSASVSAALHASAKAELNVDQIAHIAARTGAEVDGHVNALLASGRRAWHSAVRTAESLDVHAHTTAQVRLAAHADTRLSQRLMEDSRVLAKVAIKTEGRVQTNVASALSQDMTMQARVVHATLGLADVHAKLATQLALSAAAKEEASSSAQVKATSDAAASVDVTGEAKASADFAVGLGIDAITATANWLASVEADSSAQARGDVNVLAKAMSDGATTASDTVESDGLGDVTIRIGGNLGVSLDSLAQASLDATASSSAGLNVGGSTSGSDTSGSGDPSGTGDTSGSGSVTGSGTASGSSSTSSSALIGILG